MRVPVIDSGQKIITSGLVMHYDAAQLRSYPGSGTSVTDLSGNGYTGTLTNGPTFDSGNGGSFVFDGTNDHIAATNVALGANRDDQFTISVWVNIDAVTDNTMLVQLSTAALGDSGLYLQTSGVVSCYIAGFNAFRSTGNNAYSTGTWQNIVIAYDRNNSPFYRFYVNNTKTTVASGSSRTFLGSSISVTIAGLPRSFIANYFDGKIAQVLIYGRVLNDDEVGQNYNAIKSRFGL